MRRPFTFALIAGLAAMVAAILVYSSLKKREAEVQQAMVKSLNIVVAARDLPIGSKLDSGAIKLARWSRDDLPPGAVTDPALVMNQFTKTNIAQDEPILLDRLFKSDRNAGVLPLLIPPGMRALSAPVDPVSDIAGFVLPHSRVDVLVALSNSPGNGQAFSKIVLQNVEVLAVAQEVESVDGKPQEVKVVTFLVTPEQAERLSLASHEGSLRLAMRNFDDSKIVMTNGVDVSQMLGLPDKSQGQAVNAAHQTASHARRSALPVAVQVLRNGKSVEDISFVHASANQPRTPSQPAIAAVPDPAPTAAAPDPKPKLNAAPADSSDPPRASATSAARPSPAPTNSPAVRGLGGSHPKTIEIP